MKRLLLGLLVLANLLVWYGVAYSGAKDYLILAALDIGQGDAIFIEDAARHQILIDGGPDQSILSALSTVMPFTDRSLDLLVLTHPHADHITGLVEVLKHYQVGAVLETGAIYQSAVYDEWHRLLAEKKIPIIIAHRGERIKLASGAELDILTPFTDWRGRETKSIHEAMVVSRLVVATTSAALLTGDMEGPLEDQLLAAGGNLKSEILKIGHHGSKTSSSEHFVRAVAPRWAVISVGAKNPYGHPHQLTLETLKRLGIETLRTDEQGAIVFHLTNNAPPAKL